MMKMVVRFDRFTHLTMEGRLIIGLADETGRIRQVAKPMALEWVDVEPMMPVKPTLSIPSMDMEDLIQAFVDEAHKNGVKPPEPHRLEGEIQATKYHLEDLRSLLKIRKA